MPYPNSYAVESKSLTPSSSRRLAGALPALLFTLLVLAAYADPLLTGRTFVGRDIVAYNLPLEKAVHDAWARGRLPVWWETVSGGRPLLPNPNAGVFYPLRPLLALVPFPAAMRLFPVFHWILGGLGMLALARAIGGSRSAAWVAAVSFSFSGVVVSEVFYFAFQPGAALLPWTLWALVRPGARLFGRTLVLALVYGLLLLAGDAFSLALALLSAALWLLLETPEEERRPRATGLALGLAAAVLVALPQILATALLAPETRRVIGGMTLAEVMGFTISPGRLLELAVPYPFGATWTMDPSRNWGAHAFRHFFVTFFVGPIAIAGLFPSRLPVPSPGARFARALFLVTAALALSGHLLPDSWARLPSPVPLRYPEKFMLGATFALAAAAGVAVDRFRRRGAGRRWILAVAGVLAAAALAARQAPLEAGRLLVGSVGGSKDLIASAAAQAPAAFADAGLLWAATAVAAALLARRGRAPLLAALVLLTAVPLSTGRPVAQTAHDGTVYPPTPFARTIARRDPGGAFRALDESLYRPASALLGASMRGDLAGTEFFRESWFYYTPTLWDRGTVLNSDLDAGDLSRIESLRRISGLAVGQTDSGPFFASLSLRYGIRFRDHPPLAGFRPFGGDAFRAWDENPEAQPDVRLATRWREEPGPLEALALLPLLAADEVVVETGRQAQGAARPGRLRILEKSPERLALEVNCPDPTWLFVLRGDWSYRMVLLDGRPVDLSPAQIAFSALPVPAGEHRIEWRENAPGLELSRWGPAAAALLLLGLSRVRKTA